MKITSKASDYGLLLMMHLAALPPDGTTNIKKAAEQMHLSMRFLANIANKLTIARILVAQRGIGGGIKLAKPAHSISVREIIEAIDGPIQTMFCQNTTETCHHMGICNMKHFWDDVQYVVTHKLTTTTIADLQSGHGMPQATMV